MDTLRTRRWMAMAFIFCLSVPVARADVITPDSIANPPGSVGSANFTPIYSPGDLVTWDLNPKRGIPHIGIVVDQKSPDSGRYMIVHNIGEGPKMEDVLFDWKITGHYRYYGPPVTDRK